MWEAATPVQMEGLKKLKLQIDSLKALVAGLEMPGHRAPGIQESIEDVERLYIRRIRDSLIRLGISTGLPALPEVKVASNSTIDLKSLSERIDSLRQAIRILDGRYQKQKLRLTGQKEQLLAVLENAKNEREMLDELNRLHLPDSVLPKGYKSMLAFRSAGIGTTHVDYSELTARNIRITGFQAEYNPSFYVAAASGAVDYRFRDFMNSGNRFRQYLNIARVGWGMRDGITSSCLTTSGVSRYTILIRTAPPLHRIMRSWACRWKGDGR